MHSRRLVSFLAIIAVGWTALWPVLAAAGYRLPRPRPAFGHGAEVELEGTLGYFEVFTPGITPFKRVSALDGVALADGVPVLGVVDAARVPVAIEGLSAAPPDARARAPGPSPCLHPPLRSLAVAPARRVAASRHTAIETPGRP